MSVVACPFVVEKTNVPSGATVAATPPCGPAQETPAVRTSSPAVNARISGARCFIAVFPSDTPGIGTRVGGCLGCCPSPPLDQRVPSGTRVQRRRCRSATQESRRRVRQSRTAGLLAVTSRRCLRLPHLTAGRSTEGVDGEGVVDLSGATPTATGGRG